MVEHNNGTHTLIAYFSRKGDNYVNGRIVNLPVGNTKVVAEKIQKITGGDIFEIKTIKNYPLDYTDTTHVAKKELKGNERPELAEYLDSIDQYNVVFLGYPNWWNTMPMAVYSFLESCDFSGKTIIPFCTHEGSGIGKSERDIHSLCPESDLLKGLDIWGSRVNSSEDTLEHWISNLNINY